MNSIAKAVQNAPPYVVTEDSDSGSKEEAEAIPARGKKQRAKTKKVAAPKDGSAPTKDRGEKKILLEVALDYVQEYWHDTQKRGYATAKVDEHFENFLLESEEFEHFISKVFYDEYQRAFSESSFKEIRRTLEAKARYEGHQYQTHVRSAEHDGKLFIDLCTKDRQIVEITSEDWRILQKAEDCPVKFVRLPGMAPLPVPDKSEPRPLSDLLELFNMDKAGYVLTEGWTLSAWRPRGPYPMLAVRGTEDAGKSTYQRLLRGLIDPNVVPLRQIPETRDDFNVDCYNSRLLSYDNATASEMPKYFSDAASQALTGGGSAKRKHYSNHGQALTQAELPIIVNGIDNTIQRGDLLSRTITIDLSSIDPAKRLTRDELDQKFKDMAPKILAGLFQMMVSALANQSSIKLERLPRMADAAIWVEAAAKDPLWTHGISFVEALEINQGQGKEDLLEGSSLCMALTRLLPEGVNSVLEHELRDITMTELFDKLKPAAPDGWERKYWPTSPKQLSDQIRRNISLLKNAGIDICFQRKNNRRAISITRRKPTKNSPPQ